MTRPIRPHRAAPWVRRVPDFARHLADLEVDQYEGTTSRGERERVFRGAVALLDPVVEQVLDELGKLYLAGAAEISFEWVSNEGDLEAAWRLGWPDQRSARRRPGVDGPAAVGPIEISAIFPTGWTHGHLRGEHVGHWPLQVLDAADAARQYEVLWAAAEAELHEWIYSTERPWERVAPGDVALLTAQALPGGRLKAELRADGTVRGIFVTGRNPVDVLAAVAAAGLDFVIVDREHAPAPSDGDLAALCEIGFLRGISVLVRIAAPLPHLASGALDIGAAGVVVPQCRTAEEVRSVVEACYLPPAGRRGFSPRTRAAHRAADALPGANLSQVAAAVNASVSVVVQVETPELLDLLPSLVDEDRVDAYLLGAHDLAIAFGTPDADVTESTLEEMHRVLKPAGRAWGYVTRGAAEQSPAARGARFRIVGSESAILAAAISETAKRDLS